MSIPSPQIAVKVLIAAKWSEARIAKAAGTSQPTIHRLKRGTQRSVAFEVGAELIRLASDLLDKGQSMAVAGPAAGRLHELHSRGLPSQEEVA